VREKGIVLKHHPESALLWRDVGDVRPAKGHNAGIRRFVARRNAERRRLSRAGRADQSEKLPGANLE
jgi:hypothetical protein